MTWNKRLLSVFAMLLIVLPGPAGLEWAGTAAADADDGETIVNATIATPAFLQLNLFWNDGGGRFTALDLDDFYIRITGSIGGEIHENPIPVDPSSNVRVRIYGKSNFPNGIMYDINYTSGAAGSYRVLSVMFDTQELAAASNFVPVRVQFRPYDSTTGAGLPIEQFNITAQFPAQFVASCTSIGNCYEAGPEFPTAEGYLDTFFGVNLTIRASDYFGNLLYNQTRTLRFDNATYCNQVVEGDPGQCGMFTSNFQTWDIPLSVYSVKFFNQKPDQFVKFGLHWNGTTAGEEVFAPNSGLSPPWWNSQYAYRQRLLINATTDVGLGFDYNLTLAAAPFVSSGKMQSDYRDLRVVYYDPNQQASEELSRRFDAQNLLFEAQRAGGPEEEEDAAAAWFYPEGAGSTTADASSNGNTATLQGGASWGGGKTGEFALVFDGAGDYATVPDHSSLDITTALTIETWTKRGTTFSTWQRLVDKAGASGYSLGFVGTFASHTNKIDFIINGCADHLSATRISDSGWHHIAATFDTTANQYQIFVDGVLNAQGAATCNLVNTAGALGIGGKGDGSGEYLDGTMDRTRIFARVLSAQEIACSAMAPNCVVLASGGQNRDYWIYYGNSLATSPVAFVNYTDRVISESNLEMYWRSEQVSGSTEPDTTGHGHGASIGASVTKGAAGAFDESRSYQFSSSVGSTNRLTGSDAFTNASLTLEVWVNVSGTSGSFRNIIGDRETGSDFNTMIYIIGGALTLRPHAVNSAGTTKTFDSTLALVAGQWNHVVMTADSNWLRLYVNGVEDAASPLAMVSGVRTTNANTWKVGNDDDPSIGGLAGLADEVALYGGLLAAETVLSHYWEGLEANNSTTASVILDASPGFEWFQSPGETVERFLNPGYYTLQVTTDNRTGVQSKATLGVNVTEANYIMVSGLNITRFVGDFVTISTQQTVINALLRPDVLKIGELLPSAPSHINSPALYGDYVLVHPFSILTGTTDYAGAAGANVILYGPHMESDSGNGALLTTMTVTKDTYIFSGATTAHVWINDTNGNNLWENASLPPSVQLPGFSGDVVVVSNASIATQRISEFRAIWEFMVRNYPTTKRWEQSLSLNNTMNRTVLEPQWFVSFPNNTSINPDSVVVTDLDNNATLTLGRHYTVTQAGVYMDFEVFNESQVRRFLFSFYDANASDGQETQVALVTSIDRTTFDGANNFWVGQAVWSNPFTAVYDGPLAIKLVCAECGKIVPGSVHVVDANTGLALDDTQWFLSQNTILVSKGAMGEVPVGATKTYRVFFQLDLSPGSESFSWFAPVGPPIFGFQLSWARAIYGLTALLIVGYAIQTTRSKDNKKRKEALANLSFIATCISLVLFILSQSGGLS